MDRANELLRKRRRLKKLEALKVPEVDIRRNLINEFFRLVNSHDFKGVKKFLEAHSNDDFAYRCSKESHDTILVPKKTKIVGIDAFVNYVEAMTLAMPDGVFQTKDVLIRNSMYNRTKSCTIHATITFRCTAVYEVLLKGTNARSIDRSLIKRLKSMGKCAEDCIMLLHP